ncbi:hypothetical protein ACFZCL_09070 [Streptomyces sp. NPDC008159]|uniref:hypothetical protein n=1 Tax=Streptomyces sp. NPDC008159 TaxID=3364817 RepID=UPI0036ED1156
MEAPEDEAGAADAGEQRGRDEGDDEDVPQEHAVVPPGVASLTTLTGHPCAGSDGLGRRVTERPVKPTPTASRAPRPPAGP